MAGNSRVMAVVDGLDTAVGGNLKNPNFGSAIKTAAETVYEGLPGDQKTSMDSGVIERGMRTASDINKGKNVVDSTIRNNTAAAAGRVRERGAQATFNAGAKLLAPRIASRMAGAAATGGALAPIMGAMAAYDIADVGIEMISGKSIGGWAEEPAVIDTAPRRDNRGGAINAPVAPTASGTSGAWSRRRK